MLSPWRTLTQMSHGWGARMIWRMRAQQRRFQPRRAAALPVTRT